ncbi:MAG: efflux RND transporter periplasmic adaptor subunit [Lachnospirales bacterium]
MKFKSKIFTSIIIATLGLATVSCQNGEEVVEEEVYTAVKTDSAKVSQIRKMLSYTTQFQADDSQNVISPMVAKVQNTYFEVGDYVEEGDVLFDLDRESIEDQLSQLSQQVDQARVGVENAELTANSVTGGQYEANILQLESNITSLETNIATTKENIPLLEVALESATETEQLAKESLELTEEEFERSKILFDNGLKSKIEHEQSEMAVESAKNQYTNAQMGLVKAQNDISSLNSNIATLEDNLATARESLSITQNQVVSEGQAQANLGVESARNTLAAAQLQYDIASKALDDTSVKAEVSGVVNMVGVKEGDYATTSSIAYQIMSEDKISASVKVTDRVINNAQVGDVVYVEFDSLDEAVEGTIETISPSVDQTSTYTVKVVVDNDEDILLGSFAKVSFVIEEAEDSIVLDRSAVLSDEDIDYVYVDKDGVAVKQEVVLGIDNGDYVQIVDGLSDGDKVIVEGQSYVSDGENINVVE